MGFKLTVRALKNLCNLCNLWINFLPKYRRSLSHMENRRQAGLQR